MPAGTTSEILYNNKFSGLCRKKIIKYYHAVPTYLMSIILINRSMHMFIFERLKTTNLLHRALDTASLRQKVISNNIANIDVPHFKRSEVNFESELRRAIRERNDPANHLPAKMTDPRHIPFFNPRDINAFRPRINFDYTTTARNDGNNVDVEKEIVDAAKNQLQYNAYSQRIGSTFTTLKRIMQPVQ